MEALFPGVPTDSMFLVPTCQHSKMDLVKVGDDVEKEKDYCLEKVRAAGAHARDAGNAPCARGRCRRCKGLSGSARAPPLPPARVQFFAFSKAVCASLSKKEYWCDYIDPCSGLPVRRPTATGAAAARTPRLRVASRTGF